jgi:hypothetical protein
VRGKALLAFLITSWLTVATFGMHQKQPEQIGLAPMLVLAGVALLSLAVAIFGRPGVNADQRERDRIGLGSLCAACGQGESRKNPFSLTQDGYRVCASHIADPDSGLYDSRGQTRWI